MNLKEERLFDKILASVGDDGRYQHFLFYVFMGCLSVILPYTGLVQFFQISLPQHWCHVPGRPHNVSLELWKNITIPWEKEEKEEKEDGKLVRSKCRQYFEISPIIIVNKSSPGDQYSQFSSDQTANITSECRNGWDFDHTSYDSTLATEQNWVCDRSAHSATWLTIISVGNLMGTLILTYFGDKIGRKPTMMICTVMHIVLSVARLYLTQSLWIIFLMAFISGTTFPYLVQICCIVVYEQVSPRWRERVIGYSFNCWIVGICILPLIAYLSRDWKLLGIVSAVPFVPMLFIMWNIHETPRWLASKGKIERTRQVLQNIAKTNKKEWTEETENNLKEVIAEKGNFKQQSFIELLLHKTLRKRTLLLTCACITNTVIYYGLIYNTHNLSGNEFLNFFFLSIVECPGNMIGWFCGKWFGRRWTQVTAFTLASLCLFIVTLIPDDSIVLIIVLLVTCKMLICVSFCVIYMQFVEIFPTSHRASGLGFVSIVTNVIVFGVPYVAYGAKLFPKFPYVILLFVGIFGVLTASFLPETMGISLPQTIAEGENSVRGQKFCSYYGWRPKFLRSK